MAVCLFLGSWNSGSSTLGDPYKAKWPDEFGNVKTRNVDRPEIIGQYFKVSNKIDVHNQIRQNELALEQLWVSQDGWFRIITTFLGMTVTDAYLLAKHCSARKAGFQSMTVKQFALRVAHDLFECKMSEAPRSDILGSTPRTFISSNQDATETSISPLSWQDIMRSHQTKMTEQRDRNNALTRRHCSMKANGCAGKPGTRECGHTRCTQTKKASLNRHPGTTGKFICDNKACWVKHWKEEAECLDINWPSDDQICAFINLAM